MNIEYITNALVSKMGGRTTLEDIDFVARKIKKAYYGLEHDLPGSAYSAPWLWDVMACIDTSRSTIDDLLDLYMNKAVIDMLLTEVNQGSTFSNPMVEAMADNTSRRLISGFINDYINNAAEIEEWNPVGLDELMASIDTDLLSTPISADRVSKLIGRKNLVLPSKYRWTVEQLADLELNHAELKQLAVVISRYLETGVLDTQHPAEIVSVLRDLQIGVTPDREPMASAAAIVYAIEAKKRDYKHGLFWTGASASSICPYAVEPIMVKWLHDDGAVVKPSTGLNVSDYSNIALSIATGIIESYGLKISSEIPLKDIHKTITHGKKLEAYDRLELIGVEMDIDAGLLAGEVFGAIQMAKALIISNSLASAPVAAIRSTDDTSQTASDRIGALALSAPLRASAIRPALLLRNTSSTREQCHRHFESVLERGCNWGSGQWSSDMCLRSAVWLMTPDSLGGAAMVLSDVCNEIDVLVPMIKSDADRAYIEGFLKGAPIDKELVSGSVLDFLHRAFGESFPVELSQPAVLYWEWVRPSPQSDYTPSSRQSLADLADLTNEKWRRLMLKPKTPTVLDVFERWDSAGLSADALRVYLSNGGSSMLAMWSAGVVLSLMDLTTQVRGSGIKTRTLRKEVIKAINDMDSLTPKMIPAKPGFPKHSEIHELNDKVNSVRFFYEQDSWLNKRRNALASWDTSMATKKLVSAMASTISVREG